MAEFRLHALVSTLISALPSSASSASSSSSSTRHLSPELYVDFLSSNANASASNAPAVPSAALLPLISSTLMRSAGKDASANFVALYDLLHRQQFKELDAFLYLLAKIVNDKDLQRCAILSRKKGHQS